jgi:hypothetical protein
MTKWTKEDKEWLGYKRRMSVQDKSSISLSTPPWEKQSSSEFKVRSVIERSSSLATSEVDVS